VIEGRGDALLQRAHLVGQGRLVADRGRHAAEERRHLGPGLREPEDVVDEQQHVLVLDVAEVLRHRQRRQRHPEAGARRLVHLAVDQRGLLDDAGLGHLLDQRVALAGALTDAGEHRHTAEVLGDAVDHLLDQHRLAHAGTAEQADLAAQHVRRQQVDDLDAGLEHLGLRLELVERRRPRVDRPALGDLELLAVLEVQAVADDVEDVALGDVADGHRDRLAGVRDRHAAHEPVGRLHGDGAGHVVADVLRHLERQRGRLAEQLVVDRQGVVDLGHRVGRELDVDDGPDHAGDPTRARGLGPEQVLVLAGSGGGHGTLTSVRP
jgi:hypothetical protein